MTCSSHWFSPIFTFEHFPQQQRIQRRLVRATAGMRAELCERITDKEEFAVEEQGARGGDARDCRDERQGYLRDKVGKLSWKHCGGVGALCGPVLRALLAGREREVVAVAGGVGHGLGEVGWGHVAIPDQVHEAVAGRDAAVRAGNRVAGTRILTVKAHNADVVVSVHDHVTPVDVVNGGFQFDGVLQLLG
jgi:hypothetical protein